MKIIKVLAALVGLLASVFVMSGCSYVATTTDMCAYTQGDGRDGRDANIHSVYLPGQQAQKSSTENVYYFPCNARNIRLMEGSTDVQANGNPVTPVLAYTKDNIQVVVSTRMDWTLNETIDVLKTVFFPLCNKYNCATDKSDVRNANFATDGWSKGFLGENATPAYEKAVRDTITKYTYPEVMNPDIQNNKLTSDIAAAFMQNMRGTTGSTKDLMCSSGETSGWSDSAKPGEGTFTCGPVRITIDKILPQDTSLLTLQQEKTKAEMAKDINTKQLEAAKAKYGDKAAEVLGQIDIATQACAAAKSGCVVNVGNGSVAVNPTTPAK